MEAILFSAAELKESRQRVLGTVLSALADTHSIRRCYSDVQEL
jgi:hypothetical protein